MSNIIEVDGPRRAYFIDHEESNIYQSIGIMGKEPNDIAVAMHDAVETIKQALGAGIIYWRQRPEFVSDGDREFTGMYRIWCRVTTSPQLSREFWEDMPYLKAEGAEFNMIIGGGE